MTCQHKWEPCCLKIGEDVGWESLPPLPIVDCDAWAWALEWCPGCGERRWVDDKSVAGVPKGVDTP